MQRNGLQAQTPKTKAPGVLAAGEVWPRMLAFVQKGKTESARRILEDCLEHHRLFTDSAPDWEYWLTPDDRYLYVSPACETISGYGAAEFLAEPDLMMRIVHPEDLERYSNHHLTLLEHGVDGQRDLDFRIITKSGEVRWIANVCKSIYRADGSYLGLRGINRDGSQHKSAEWELQRITRLYATLSDSSKCIVRASSESELFSEICRIAVQVGGLTGCLVTMLDPESDIPRPTTHRGLDAKYVEGLAATLAEPENTCPAVLPLRDGKPHLCNDIQGNPTRCARKEAASEIGIHTCVGYPLRRDGRTVGSIGFYAGESGYFSDDVVHLLAEMAEDVSFALDHFAHERQRLEYMEKLRQSARVFENTAEGVIITDDRTRILAVNPAFTKLTGYEEAEVLDKTPAVLKSGRQSPSFYKGMWYALEKTGTWQGEIWNRRKEGEIYPEWLTISSIRDDSGQPTHYVGVFSDISRVKRAQAVQEFLAYHDALTGLPNRSLLRARLEHVIQQAGRGNRGCAVLFLDLDRFKDVNDALGHSTGDELLRMVAGEMGKMLRTGDTLARLGGDEFIILIEDSPTPEQVALISNKLLSVFEKPFVAADNEIFVTASIGISLFPTNGNNVDTLISNADLAMYQAKAKGRNTFQFYEAEMTRHVLERTGLEKALRRALGRNEFMLHYQPQVDLETGTLLGVEALIRWQHPELGLVSPARFIPVAEEIGLIGEIGAWVLREACRQAVDWHKMQLSIPSISVNLSVRQLEKETLLNLVRSTLAETGLEPNKLELEVTESMIMRQTDNAISVLGGLREMGIRLAVDDFGTGYSSLSYLQKLPLNRLKIDQTFVRDLNSNEHGLAIVRAIIALGRSLGLDVVAEGVEDESQVTTLRSEGCQSAQGYLFGRPVGAIELERVWGGKSLN